MKKNYFFKIVLFSILLVTNSFSQTVVDDFTDGNFTANQTWSGSTSLFSVITDATLPSGNATTDGSFLASDASQGDVSLTFASTEVSEWRFSIGSPDFDPSSSNYIGVVLMASSIFSGDLVGDDVTNDFQGYYLRIGVNGSTDPISLYRKTGTGEEAVGDFPLSPSFGTGALRDGLNIRVTRSSAGVFELFYSIGFLYDELPSTSAGTLTNDAYSSSSYFGVFQNIASTSSIRRVYIDNIQLGVVTWEGDDIGSPNDWNTSANWDTNMLPTSSDNLIIPSGLLNYPTVSSTVTINSLEIASGGSLIATNTFTTTNSSTFKVNLGTGGRWYLLSSPVSSETYNTDWATANSIPTSSLNTNNIGIGIYTNDEVADTNTGGSDTATGFWRYLQSDNSNSTTFNVGQGYSIIRSSSGDLSFIGTGLYTSSQTESISLGESNFNLIGNPFTAHLNLGDFYADNGSGVIVGGATYCWDGNAYETKTLADSAYEIRPGEGFFVEAAANTNVTFDINDVSHQTSISFSKSNNVRPEIHLTVKESNNQSPVRILYIDGTTTGYDLGYDGKLFGGVSHSFVAYSDLVDSDGNNYQTQVLPNSDHENMVIPIGLKAGSGKTITFTAEALNIPNGLNVYLEDRQTGDITKLDETNAEYKVTLTENVDGIGRFYLHTRTNSVLSTDDVVLNSVRIFTPNSNTLRIAGLQQGNTSIKIFNMLGKQVVNTSFTTTGVSDVDLPNLSTGVYIVQLETASGSINKKITLE